MSLHKYWVAIAVGSAWAVSMSPAWASPVLESEGAPGDNDTFATREVLPAGTTHVLGEIAPIADLSSHDYSFSGTLTPDGVDTYTLSDLPPGTPFYVWIDNTASGIDTVLGTFDEDDSLINYDDDSSIAGVGLGSAIGGEVNPDGTIHLKVTGFPDFNFDGMYDTDAFGPDPFFPEFTGPEGEVSVSVQVGVSDFSGIDTANPDYTFTEMLTPGEVAEVTVPDLNPGDSFVAWTDNTTSEIDTVLGMFDPSGELIDFNDDGSPVGNGLASGVVGTVNDDGTISLRITGYPDFDFDGEYNDGFEESEEFIPPPVEVPEPGPHGVQGDYEVYVKLGIDRLTGDVDYLSFTGLEPGSSFVAEVTLANFDTVLGWYGDDGVLISTDDDGSGSFLSRLEGTVPTSGVVNLAVTSYPDFEFTGDHTTISGYVLQFDN